MAEAAANLGYPVYQTVYEPGSKAPDPNIPFGPGCVMTYGTHQFVRQASMANAGKWSPGAFSRIERLSYSAYAPYIGDILLNDDFILLPYGEVLRRGFDAFGDAYFLKPDAVTKAFTGFVMTRDKYQTEVETLKKSVYPEMICVVAKPRSIEAEFRFVIADRQVVAGSQYRWEDRLDVRLDVLPICRELAQEVAQREWQADRCYTCDVALLDGRSKARIVELNTFSSSGLYACDTEAVVDAVSRAAWREYLGEDD
jgi:hypothetical protein